MKTHENYIRRCFELAQRGLGKAAPNPLVGSVIVHNNRIIGEGFHELYGQAHAEVNAINSVAAKDVHLLAESTIYVNMEPCNFQGNTPACSKLLVEKGFKQLVISTIDSHPKVAGQGLETVKKAGINVLSGLLEEEGKWLNRRFYTLMEQKRPYIILKWAQSADGYIGRNNGEQILISNKLSQQYVHKWRSEENGILIGAQTAINDYPKLTNRYWGNQQPVRILFDPQKRVPKQWLEANKSIKTLVIYNDLLKSYKITDKLTPDKFINLFFNYLRTNEEVKLQSILVEGGQKTLQNFIDSGYWDEARIITSEAQLKTGVSAPKISGKIIETKSLFTDQITVLKNEKCSS